MEHENEQIELKGGRLTALSVQKGNPDRLSLFIDDEFMLGVRRELVIKHGLVKKGMEVTVEQLVALQQEEEAHKARDLAAKYLTARMRTRKQVADYLAGKGYDETVVADTIGWLDGYGYLDDGEYAKRFVESRLRSRPRGRAMLRWELQQKGVAAPEIEEAFSEELDSAAEVEAAIRLLQKKAGRLARELTYEERGKLGQFLQRKGFSHGIIRDALASFRNGSNLDND